MIRILGIGSPFGADRVGWQVIDDLALRLSGAGCYPCDGIALQRLDRPGAALVGLLADARQVILIDAMQGGFPFATVKELTNEALLQDNRLISSHGFGLAEALQLAKSLKLLPSGTTLFGIEIGAVDRVPDTKLAPELQKASMGVAAQIHGRLAAALGTAFPSGSTRTEVIKQQ